MAVSAATRWELAKPLPMPVRFTCPFVHLHSLHDRKVIPYLAASSIALEWMKISAF